MGALVLIAFVLSVLVALPYLKKKRGRLPPGPKGLPIVGNAWDMPRRWEWLTYEKWGQDYKSDIIFFKLFNTPIVVLNSEKAAHDLLEKRSSVYSDRQHQVMLLDLIGWDKNMGLMGYGDHWREHRRLFNQHFRKDAVHRYQPLISQHSRKLLHCLLTRPASFMDNIRAFGGSMALDAVYGIETREENDPYILLIENAVHSLIVTANAGSYAVDYFSWLKYVPSWVPGAGFKRDAVKWRGQVTEMFDQPFDFVKRSMVDGSFMQPSLVSSLLSELGASKDNAKTESIIRNIAGTAYIGGADTVVGTLWSFVLAMLIHPEVQRTAQAEIDRVIGSGRLPEYGDKDALPYVTAVMKESLRWRPIVPLGVAHRLMVDDEYQGYHIPAGTVVIANSRAMLHDTDNYTSPNAFDPTRYLRQDGAIDVHAPDPLFAAFGFGRRVCPGRHLATDVLWLVQAHILSVFNIEKPVDQFDNVVEPTGEYTSGLASFPVPFKACFAPRSDAAKALIQCASSYPE